MNSEIVNSKKFFAKGWQGIYFAINWEGNSLIVDPTTFSAVNKNPEINWDKVDQKLDELISQYDAIVHKWHPIAVFKKYGPVFKEAKAIFRQGCALYDGAPAGKYDTTDLRDASRKTYPVMELAYAMVHGPH